MNARFQVYQFDSATWVVTDTAVNAQVCKCCDLDGHPLSARERAQMIAEMFNRAAALVGRVYNLVNEWLDEMVDAGKVIEQEPVTRGEVKDLVRKILQAVFWSICSRTDTRSDDDSVYVLVIDTDDGPVVWVCRSEEAAWQELEKYVRENWPGNRPFPEDPTEAVEWYFVNSIETYSIEQVRVLEGK